MSDLISRSALINKIRGIVPSSQDVDFIVRLIEEQPTAYDVDKVVAELEELPNREADYYYANSNDVIDREDAIEIVKQGGVSNDVCEWRLCDEEANAVGDRGNSLGIMQIQSKWHQERMDKLGRTDLMDARQNMMIGIDILLDLYSKNDDTAWVLMAYNGGVDYANRHYYAGNISEYAEYIMARAEELEQMGE